MTAAVRAAEISLEWQDKRGAALAEKVARVAPGGWLELREEMAELATMRA